MRISCLLLIFIFFFMADAIAQQRCTLTFSGQVLDEDHDITLPGASVFIKELNRGVITDDKGHFVFNSLCKGSYTVMIHSIGHVEYELKISIEKDLNRKFVLQHNASEIDRVEILSQRLKERSTLIHTELRGVDLEQTRGQSLGDALKKIPGVTTLQTGPTVSKPVIQGMHSNRILILNNGIRQEGQQWGSEHAPEIDPFIANKLTVIKGANSVRYGADAIAGVILVEPKEFLDSAGIEGELNLVGISNGRQGVVSGILEGRFSKAPALAWRAQGTLRRAGNIRTPDYFLKNTGLEEKNFSAALAYQKKKYGADIFYSQFNTQIGVFSGSHIGNLTDLNEALHADRPKEEFNTGFSYQIDRPYQQVEHELFKLKSYLLIAGSKLSLTYARQYNLRDEYDKDKPLNDSLAALNRPELHYEITSHSVDMNLEHSLSEHISGMIGVSALYQKNTFQGRQFIPNFENYTAGAYWIERLQKNKFEWELGVRYDYRFLQIYKYSKGTVLTPTHSYSNVSFNFGTEYKATPDIHYHLNIGTAFRAPSVNELYADGLHHGSAQILTGNPELKTEKALVLISGIEISPKKRFNGQLDVYYKSIADFIYLDPKLPPQLTIRGAFPAFAYKQTDAYFYGTDAAFNFLVTTKLTAFTKMNMIRAVNRSTGKYLPMIPSDRFENGLKWTENKIGVLRETEFRLSALNVLKQYRMDPAQDYKAAPDGYVLFNFDLSTALTVYKQNFDLGFSVANILNEKYREYMNAFRYFADEPGRSFTVRIKYHINH